MSHFRCAYCNHDQIVTTSQWDSKTVRLDVNNKHYGEIGFYVKAISCANPKCHEITLTGGLEQLQSMSHGWRTINQLQSYQLRPSSTAKPQPECVPAPLANDYYEACSIEKLSPKASATLSRRCLQGMIRDFCGITERTLNQEIKTLHKQVEDGTASQGVTEDTLAAIDAVRSIGNIGAHMEADINLIIDIDPGEAQALIELIELLFADWYVAREARRQRLAKVQAIAEEKKRLLEPPSTQQPSPPGMALSLLGQSTKLPE